MRKQFCMIIACLGGLYSVANAVPHEAGGMMAPAAITIRFAPPIDASLAKSILDVLERYRSNHHLDQLEIRDRNPAQGLAACVRAREYWQGQNLAKELQKIEVLHSAKVSLTYSASCYANTNPLLERR